MWPEVTWTRTTCFTDSSEKLAATKTAQSLNHRHPEMAAAAEPGATICPGLFGSQLTKTDSSINPAVPGSAVKVRRQRVATGADQLSVDGPTRNALSFVVMTRARTERPIPSPAALVRETNHVERNDVAAISEMMPQVYEDLRRLAETFLRGERTAHTLQRTALVHEAFLRLIGEKNLVWQNRSHFIGIFARVMRQTLTNYAVARHRLKRGGSDPLRLTLEFYDSRKIDVTALDQALQALEALDERQARIVELRFFAGLTVEETAELLEISPATVKRDWTLAKIWLRRELSAN
jgi:RNA polymerase sigma factor (TIGR02999 family)